MQLSQIFIHPLKSAAPLPLDSGEIEPRGLAGDRRWMAVDVEGRFVSARELPALVTIEASLAAPRLLRLRDRSGAWFDCAEPPANAERLPVRVWKDTVSAALADAAAGEWLSQRMGRELRLVYMDATATRPVDPDYAGQGDEVSFADGYPLLLLSQAALDALNDRLQHPLPITRFRPNLVVEGCAAHAEDGWKRIRIGTVEFDVAKPCTRCVLTTVQPETGTRDPDGEPLNTLKTYRRGERGITFGQNIIPRGVGRLQVGMTVTVLS